MAKRYINSPDAPDTAGGYAQAVEVARPERWLHVSGQIPVTPDGRCPDDFESQCRLVWRNLMAQLHAADMTAANLVKVTTFLARREDRDASSSIRKEVLGERQPALTVIVTGIYDTDWLVEVEAVAAA
jgi:enamine deaminase RidA (YjgF/YER057c/UK114 family)